MPQPKATQGAQQEEDETRDEESIDSGGVLELVVSTFQDMDRDLLLGRGGSQVAELARQRGVTPEATRKARQRERLKFLARAVVWDSVQVDRLTVDQGIEGLRKDRESWREIEAKLGAADAEVLRKILVEGKSLTQVAGWIHAPTVRARVAAVLRSLRLEQPNVERLVRYLFETALRPQKFDG